MEKTGNKDVVLFCYAWGKNKDGELSLGHTKSVNKCRIVKGILHFDLRFEKHECEIY